MHFEPLPQRCRQRLRDRVYAGALVGVYTGEHRTGPPVREVDEATYGTNRLGVDQLTDQSSRGVGVAGFCGAIGAMTFGLRLGREYRRVREPAPGDSRRVQ